MSTAAKRTARVVRDVVAQAIRDARAGGVVVLDDWTPEGELVYEWLTAELGEEQVWRAASLASNVQPRAADFTGAQQVAAWRTAQQRGALVAHPANKTVLLLSGRLPWADILPLGDMWASQVEAVVSSWSGPREIEDLAATAGGIVALDAALSRLIEAREDAATAFASLPGSAGQQLAVLYERGRFFRLRPRLVPKLGTRTLGIDLFD